MISRRKLLKILAGFPLIGSSAFTGGFAKNSQRTNGISTAGRDLFCELDIRTFINARGTLTYLSGSLMLPEVTNAINSTSLKFANLNEVQDKVGGRIAQLLNCEAAMVTSGAASAMTLATAAAITGTNEKLIRLLPNLPAPKREVIIQKTHRFPYDHAVRNTGVDLIEVDGPDAMEQAINKRTVLSLFFNAANEHSIGHEEFVAICKRNNIPSFNDAAADVPPVENLFKYIEMGFDLVTFSGGKAIRGPQSAGLLYGRKDLIEAAKLNWSPNSDTIGRGMKVNKEEIFGMLMALELYLAKDHEKEWQEWLDRTGHIAESANKVPGVSAKSDIHPGPANHFPGVSIIWNEEQVAITPEEAENALRNGSPSIEVGRNREGLNINVVLLKPEEVDIVAQRVKEVLEEAVL